MQTSARIVALVLLTFSIGYAQHNHNAVRADFSKADSVAALYSGHSLMNLKALSDKLTRPLRGEEEKFRAIYRWVCLNIENDYNYYIRNKRKREKLTDNEKLKAWSIKFSRQVFKKLVRERKTVCTGYAYLVRELAYHTGITCEIIDGYGRTIQANIGGTGVVNHSWNAVRLNGNWYLCDPTWSSGTVDPEKAAFVQQFEEAYFLADPSLFALNHYPSDSTWLLLNQKPSLQEFLNAPLVYRGALSYAVRPVAPAIFDVETKKGEVVTFRLHTVDDSTNARPELEINRGSQVNRVSSRPYHDESGLYCLDYTFKSKGKYIVHVLLNNSYVVTYTVHVSG